jgi:DNA mismatch endonuclease (patch repair protein)
MTRSANMRAIRSKDMKPELAVRKLVHGLGFRFRLHRNDLPGRPDLVFPSLRRIIFVHGCFWHSHGCKLSHIPKSNTEYWVPKLQRNSGRDRKNRRELKALGWTSLVLWECELPNVSRVRKRICDFLAT